MDNRVKVVINPVAGKAKAKKNWPGLKKSLEANLGEFSWEFTEQKNHATTLTQNALREGFETIVAAGGDGTISEVANGFYENGNPINQNAKLGIIPMGTGGDLVRTLGIPKTVEQASLRIKQGNTIKSDLGFLMCRRITGGDICRYFINVSDAGFGGTLINLSNHSTKKFGPTLAYLIALLKTLKVHRDRPIQIKIDNGSSGEQLVKSVVVANGKFFGGGMLIAPEAVNDDGFLNIVVLGNLSTAEVLLNLLKLYNGRLAEHPKVHTVRGKKVELSSEFEVLIEADGEMLGKLPASYQIIPSAINLIY